MESPAVLVTGAGTRLGRLLAMHMASLGYDIAIHCNSSIEGAKSLAKALESSGCRSEIFPQDFTETFDSDHYLQGVLAAFPNLECVLNNASAYEAAGSTETDRGLLETQFRVNFVTPYLLAASFARLVKKGQVINILDNKIAYNQYQYSAYLLSKKTLAEHTRLAALEYAPTIRVNGIAPGVTLPGDTRTDDYIQWRLDGIPLKKQGSDQHLKSALSFLIQNDFVTGQILFVDGGESLNQVGRNHENYVDATK
ncbi:MAG: SDR family oxidoreductase [Ketobacter sp.]|nr:MAG: SDR family oxidoreductase [Ketobacter sp.]